MSISVTGLEAYYDFEGTNSYTGSGTTITAFGQGVSLPYNGTLNGNTVYDTEKGGCFSFDGNGDYIQFAHRASLSMSSSVERSVHLWIKWTGTSYEGLVGKQVGGVGWTIGIEDGKVRLYWFNGTTGYSLWTASAVITQNRWHNVAVSFRASTTTNTVRIFVDGVNVLSTRVNNATAPAETNPIRIGCENFPVTDNNWWFTGKIGEIGFYNSAPTDSVILSNFNNTKDRYVNATIVETPATASSEFVDPVVSTTKNFTYNQSSIITTALMANPTVVIVNYDTTQIWTGIVVDALFPNATITVQTNVSNPADPMTASAEMDQHTIIAGTGPIFNAEEATASAQFVIPAFAGSGDKIIEPAPMTATNAVLQGDVYVTPNYKNLVLQKTPSLFITDPVDTSPNDQNQDPFDAINIGYENWGSANPIASIVPVNTSAPMSAIGNGKAITKVGSVLSGSNWFEFVDFNADARSLYFNTPGNSFTVELWLKPTETTLGNGQTIVSWITSPRIRTINRIETRQYLAGYAQNGAPIYKIGYKAEKGIQFNLAGDNGHEHLWNVASGTWYETGNETADEASANAELNAGIVFDVNLWNHIVCTANFTSTNTVTTQIWLNGIMRSTQTTGFTNASPNGAGFRWTVANTAGLKWQINQLALYKNVSTNSDIIQRYNFIATSSPNRIVDAEIIEVNALFPDAQVSYTWNETVPGDVVTASAVLVNPTLDVQVGDIYNAELMEASALMEEPFFYGDPDATILADQLVANGDFPNNVYRLDTKYSTYVKQNIAPFRYAPLDSPTTNTDFGSDNDYGSAAPFVYGGTITQPIFGLNNNSLLTDGNDYTTSGLIMKESEHDDDWGTASKVWHTSFWIKKDATDINPNGLRIVANLNGFKDNQYILVYQYNNKLFLEINNQSAPVQIFESSVNVNLFDFAKHHIVIASTSNDKIHIYNNANQIMDCTLTSHVVTTNSVSALPPNTETNNKPRFAVGALITPYAETDLPAIPTASIMYIDDVHWAITTLNQTGVNNLYAQMPYRQDLEWDADPALSNFSELVTPLIGTGVGNTVNAAVATNAQLIMPTVTVDFESINSATAMTASAEAIEPFSVIADNITNINVVSDVFVASAQLLTAQILISIPASTMTATARMAGTKPYISEWHLLVRSQTAKLAPSGVITGAYGVGDIR